MPTSPGDQTALGRRLLYESGNDPWRVMLWARLPVIVLTLLFGLVVLAFARELVGAVGGLVALALYAYSPNIITNGSLATLDVPAAGFPLTAVWLVAGPTSAAPAPPRSRGGGARRGARHQDEHPAGGAGAAAPGVPLLLAARRTPGLGLRAQPRLVGLGVAMAAGTALVALAVLWATSSSTRTCVGRLPRTSRPCTVCVGS